MRCQKTQHVVGRLARDGRGGHADLELRALGLANHVARGARFTQNVDHQHVAIPGKKGIAGDVFDLAAAHGANPSTTRRVLADFFSILVTMTAPISAVLATWVPPQGWKSINSSVPIRIVRILPLPRGGCTD